MADDSSILKGGVLRVSHEVGVEGDKGKEGLIWPVPRRGGSFYLHFLVLVHGPKNMLLDEANFMDGELHSCPGPRTKKSSMLGALLSPP